MIITPSESSNARERRAERSHHHAAQDIGSEGFREAEPAEGVAGRAVSAGGAGRGGGLECFSGSGRPAYRTFGARLQGGSKALCKRRPPFARPDLKPFSARVLNPLSRHDSPLKKGNAPLQHGPPDHENTGRLPEPCFFNGLLRTGPARRRFEDCRGIVMSGRGERSTLGGGAVPRAGSLGAAPRKAGFAALSPPRCSVCAPPAARRAGRRYRAGANVGFDRR